MKKNKGVPGCELATYRHAHQKQACTLLYTCVACFFFQAEDGIRDSVASRGLGDVYKRQCWYARLVHHPSFHVLARLNCLTELTTRNSGKQTRSLDWNSEELEGTAGLLSTNDEL